MKRIDTLESVKEPFYYAHRKFFVGLFLVIPLFVFIGLTIYTIVSSELLENWVELHIKSESGAGLIEGRTPVLIMGIDVGHIYKVDINRKGFVDVSLRIKEKYIDLIHTDSKARLKQKNMVVGSWLVDITPGSNAYLPVSNGDTLAVEVGVRLDEVMEIFTDLMEPLKSIVKSLQDGEGIMQYIIGSDTLLVDVKRLVNSANNLMQSASGTIKRADNMIGDFSDFSKHGVTAVDTLFLFAQKANKMVSDFNKTVFEMDTLVEDLGEIPVDFHNVIIELSDELKEMAIIFDALENHWLLKRSVKRVKRKALEEDTK